MSKRTQAVVGSITHSDGQNVTEMLEGTNDRNLQTKLLAWLRQVLIQHNVDEGATIVLKIEPAEVDEFTRPLPE